MQLKKTKQNIVNILAKRELENIKALQLLEKILLNNRKKIFSTPKTNSRCIVLFSGGMDSVALSFLLLEKYKLHIYPIFIKRSQQRTRQELNAARFYVKQMQSKYGQLCDNLTVIKAAIPPKKIRYPLALFSNNLYYENKKSNQRKGLPVYLLSLAAVAVQYACFLELTEKIKIKTIFCGLTAGDGTVMAYETLTALRASMVSICLLQNDFSWQFTSPFIEKEMGLFLEKHEIINWCFKNKIDLEKTWSCYYPFKFHCGECMGCAARKEHFSKSNAIDKTIYQKPNRIEKKAYKIWKELYEKYHKFHF
jgi:7-cyano-7-deazaguanine synthase in queuosine biosynthesis